MRKFHTLLIALLLTFSPNIQAQVRRGLDQTLERTVTTHVQKAQQPAQRVVPLPSHLQPAAPQTRPAQAPNTWFGLPIISWANFESNSQHFIEKKAKLDQLYTQLFELIDFSDEVTIQSQQGTPSYAQATAHTKYIYIGETHDTPIVQQEIKKLITTIRQENPNKKILLATEFVVTPHPLVNPLLPAQKFKTPLVGDPYYQILDFTIPLRIDTLALDDEIFHILPNGKVLLKVGDRYIHVDLQHPQVSAMLAPFKTNINIGAEALKKEDPTWFDVNHRLSLGIINVYLDILKQQDNFTFFKSLVTSVSGPGNENLLATVIMLQQESNTDIPSISDQDALAAASARSLINTIQASPWGVIQRNKQWAKRIQQVEKNYDIIIVWAGSGHMDSYYLQPSVPQLLARPDAISFEFDAIMPDAFTGDGNGYSKRAEALHNQKLETCSSIEMSSDQIGELLKNCQPIDPNQTYFLKVVPPTNGSEEKEQDVSPQVENIMEQIDQLEPINYQFKESYEIFLK